MQWSVALEGGPRRVNHAAVRATFITFAESIDFPLGDVSQWAHHVDQSLVDFWTGDFS